MKRGVLLLAPVALGLFAATSVAKPTVVRTEGVGGTANSAIIGIKRPATCPVANDDQIRISITSGGQTRTGVLAGRCGPWITKLVGTPRGWRISLVNQSTDAELDGNMRGAFLRLRLAGQGNYSRLFLYSVTMGKSTISEGVIRGRRSYERPRVIWQGTDAFVNYCINETRRIYSHSGRLYCWTEYVSDTQWTFF